MNSAKEKYKMESAPTARGKPKSHPPSEPNHAMPDQGVPVKIRIGIEMIISNIERAMASIMLSIMIAIILLIQCSWRGLSVPMRSMPVFARIGVGGTSTPGGGDTGVPHFGQNLASSEISAPHLEQ